MSIRNMYVFYTKAGNESKAADDIKKYFIEEKIVPFNFTTELFYKRKGKVRTEIKPVFPGYLFIMSHMNNDEFVSRTYELIRRSQNIIKLLQYGDSGLAAIKKDEKDILDNLFQTKKCIESSYGYIKGDKLVITDGPFVGRESIFKSVDRHKRQAIIELQIMGEMRKVSVGLEIIAKYN